MIAKFVRVIRKNSLFILKDLGMLAGMLACLIGSVLYVFSYHKDRESYALNIALTALVSRITGVELMEALKIRLQNITYYTKRILRE